VAKDTLDEWTYFLKNAEIKDEFSAKGLKEAKSKLDVMKLPREERLAYRRYLDDLSLQASMIQSSYGIGVIEDEKKGRKEGEETKAKAIAEALKEKGVAPDVIAEATGLTVKEIEGL